MLWWFHDHLNGLVQERRNSSSIALELRFSCTNSSNSYLYNRNSYFGKDALFFNINPGPMASLERLPRGLCLRLSLQLPHGFYSIEASPPLTPHQVSMGRNTTKPWANITLVSKVKSRFRLNIRSILGFLAMGRSHPSIYSTVLGEIGSSTSGISQFI